MDLDDKHHVIQLNKLKFKQNNQIDRLVKAVEAQFADSNKGLDASENSFTKVSSILNSKFLSDDSASGDRNVQRQSVISVQTDKPHFIKLSSSRLFTKIPLEDYLRPEVPNKSHLLQVRKEFKGGKFEHKSFVHKQTCHLHKNQFSDKCFFCK